MLLSALQTGWLSSLLSRTGSTACPGGSACPGEHRPARGLASHRGALLAKHPHTLGCRWRFLALPGWDAPALLGRL